MDERSQEHGRGIHVSLHRCTHICTHGCCIYVGFHIRINVGQLVEKISRARCQERRREQVRYTCYTCIYVYIFVHTGDVYTLDFIHSTRENAVKSTGAIYTIDFICVYIFVHTSAVYTRDLKYFYIFVHGGAECRFKFRTCIYMWQPTEKIAAECSQERGHGLHIRFHICVSYFHLKILAQKGRSNTIFKYDRYMHFLFHLQIHTSIHSLTFSKNSQCKHARTHTNQVTHTHAHAHTHTHTHTHT